MIFRTELTVAPVAVPLPSTARVLTIGSCFAAVLAQKLAAAKLPVLENPFGTVLNPISACRLLAVAAGADEFDLTERTIQRDGRWFSYDAPSGVSGATFEELQAAIDERLTRVRDFVRTADALVLTMGTAWAWRLDGEVVANCHKQPGGLFQKTLLSVQEIVAAFAEMHSWLLRLNPKLRVVLTVSPVRHPKETLPGSSVSKSTLRLACHHLDALVRDVTYFPAYELLLDDLRDYRFFAADMLHPSAMAEDYIFDKFAGAYFDARFAAHREAWEEIKRAMAHRSANPQGEAHQQFLLNTLAKLDALEEAGIEVRGEMAELEAQLVRPRRPKLPALPPKLEVKADGLPQIKPVSEGKVESSAASPKAPVPVSGAGDAPRPIKPIIKIELPPLTPRPDRNGQRNQPLVRPVRPVVRVELPVEAPQAAAPQLPTEVPAAAEATVENTPAASAAQQQPVTTDSPNKKRRGRRGGRRHKQRREDGLGEILLPLDTLPALETELVAVSEAAAETAVTQELPTSASASSLLAPALPAEEVAAENALTQPLETPEVDSANRPIAAPRRPNRQTRGRGGKKVTLQKVKPESKPATASPVAETVVLPAATAPIAVPAAPEKAQPAREERQRKPRPAPVAAPAVVAPGAEKVPPTAPVAAPLATPPAKPAKQQSMNARTPGRSSSKGPVATPVERAAAARATKKAGVGALLAALGGAAPAAPVPVPAPIAAPVPAPVAVTPPVVGTPEPVTVAAKAKPAVKATATKPKPATKAPKKLAVEAPELPVEPTPAPLEAKAPAKKPKPAAKAAKPAAVPVPPAAPEPPSEPVAKAVAKRPAKPRTPKNK